MAIEYVCALDKEDEEIIVETFRRISPTDIINSKKLVASFREFFERGTVDDCLQLVPQTHRAGFLASPSTEVQPTANASLSPSGIVIAKRLEAIAGCMDATKTQRLVQTIQAFEAATHLSSKTYESLWSANGGFFEGVGRGSAGRVCQLQRGQRSSELSCADRLSLMFLTHDVDRTAASKHLKLKTGWGRKTAALHKLAEDSGTPVKDLKEDCKRSRNYYHLLNKAGPGSLLEIGPAVATIWEKNLTIQDIETVLKYRDTHLPNLKRRSELLDALAASTIIDGLYACGWTLEDLISSPTPLINGIGKYLPWLGSNIVDRQSKKRPSDQSSVDAAKCKKRAGRGGKPHVSSQTPFDFAHKNIDTRSPLCNIGVENQRLSSCSPIPAAANPSSEATFSELGQSTMTNAFRVDALDGVTTETTIEERNLHASTDPFLIALLETSGLLSNWIESDTNQGATDPYSTGRLETLPILIEPDTSHSTTDPYFTGLLETSDPLPNWTNLDLDPNSTSVLDMSSFLSGLSDEIIESNALTMNHQGMLERSV